MFKSNQRDKLVRNKLHKDNQKKKRYDGNLKITSEESMTMYTHTHTSKHRIYLPIIGKEDTTIKLSVFTNYKFNMIVTKKSLLDLFKKKQEEQEKFRKNRPME